jgi:hypothetical protein
MFGAGVVIQVWIIQDGAANADSLAAKLEKVLADNPAFKGSLIYTDGSKKADLEKVAAAEKIEKADLAVLVAANKDSTMKAFKLSAEARNTIHVYKNKKVAATFVDVGDGDFAKVVEAAKAL